MAVSDSGRRPPKFPLQLKQMAPTPRRFVVAPVAAAVKRAATTNSDAGVPAKMPARSPLAAAAPTRPTGGPAKPPAAPQRLQSTGHGLDSNAVRQRMVERLRQGGVRSEALLSAMAEVPRHRFVDTAFAAQAYEDTSLPIGFEQTISKPSVVARMIDLLFEGANARESASLGRVLEIGTGCGYQAAVLARLARHVYSIERLKPLHEKARENLAGLREHRIRLVYGDGRLGHGPNAPYDSIIAAAGGDELPRAWFDQLAPGGRLIAPKADARSGSQVLVVVDRTQEGYVQNVHEAVMFVPLKSGLD